MFDKEKRREKILEAAANSFYSYGYSATSVDDIIKQVGGSKRTIYKEFGNKEGIFKELILTNTDDIIKALENENFENKTLKSNLAHFGFTLVKAYMQPKMLGIFKVILIESNRFPELAKLFFENGPQKVIKILDKIFKDAVDSKEIETYDIRDIDSFVGMLRGNLHFRVLLALEEIPSPDIIDAHVKSVVELFLNGLINKTV
ncbi:TetR/AcrR family transcriptional regulator [Halarcobacter anaerophilus]|uniref:TetR family transcriptional regulator n=1 Tax=Halarcobacter anaerophilus TaxID=877500 RepID=A0A4V1LQ43_9BACT|nr:TetR/AcrR family transcriptional regulator [Halarcobacter anaerophilus]QDF28679.1 transcriptional regulator, TetR/AcrR family [Halarcobacter anaerophilus]RXJ63398.1 TetR family transcriptional regulator [Halarcobacter anaerophilus]